MHTPSNIVYISSPQNLITIALEFSNNLGIKCYPKYKFLPNTMLTNIQKIIMQCLCIDFKASSTNICNWLHSYAFFLQTPLGAFEGSTLMAHMTICPWVPQQHVACYNLLVFKWVRLMLSQHVLTLSIEGGLVKTCVSGFNSKPYGTIESLGTKEITTYWCLGGLD